MGHRIVASSGDVAIEAEAPTPGEVLVEVARAFSEVVTGGTPLRSEQEAPLEIEGADRPALLVRFVNELVFRFETEGFLAAGGDLRWAEVPGRVQVEGRLRGDRWDPGRHGHGTEVKAATFHGLAFDVQERSSRIHVLLDL